jgi:hypothetical protein
LTLITIRRTKTRKTIVVPLFVILFLLLFSIGSAQSLKATIPLGVGSNFKIIPEVGSTTHENLSLYFKHVIVDSTDYANVRAIGDVDGDGFPDIIAAKDGSGLTWYKYPNWSKYSIQSFNWRGDDVKCADIDGDGDPDVVGVQDNDGKVCWFENPRPSGNLTGNWTSHYMGSCGDYVKNLAIADFNRDGKLDVVTRTISTISVFLQNNATSWTRVTIVNYHSGDGLDVGDLDGDGDSDIILNGFWLENPYPNVLGTWYEHNIDSKWWNQNTGNWQDNNSRVVVADINGDGHLDVLISASEKAGYPISWYEASDPKNGPWTEHVIGYLDYCHTLQAGDMDNDGNMDVIAGKFERPDGTIPPPYSLRVYCNRKGDGLSWNVTEVSDLGIYLGVIGDVGNDGDLDIVGSRSYWKGPIEIWENKIGDNRVDVRTPIDVAIVAIVMAIVIVVVAGYMLMKRRQLAKP